MVTPIQTPTRPSRRHLDQCGRVTDITSGYLLSQPHRALWDTIGAALLLNTLIAQRWNTDPNLDDLLAVADPTKTTAPVEPTSLLDLLTPPPE